MNSIASSSCFILMKLTTGPKISSLAIFMSGVTLSNTVGPMKYPFS